MHGRHVDPGGAIYAEALAGVVEAEGGLEALRETGERLAALGAAWREDRTLRAFFLSAEVSGTEKRAALDSVAALQPRVLGNFLRLLLARGRLVMLGQIEEAFAAILDRKLGRVPATLTTAVPMPEERLEAWRQALAAATGLEPVLRHVVRPEIVAGAIVQVGDTVADGSARRRLGELRRQILERGIHAVQS
jgi:F-type H+-transporting ATPase subunit delta